MNERKKDKSGFAQAYEDYLDASHRHMGLYQILSKLSVLAGIVYDPEQDSEMDPHLSELSRQVFVLGLYDRLDKVLGQRRDETSVDRELLKQVLEKLGQTDILKPDAEANYPKVLGWALAVAKDRNLLTHD